MLFRFLKIPPQQAFLIILLPFFLITITAKRFIPKKHWDSFIVLISAVFILASTGIPGIFFILIVLAFYFLLGKKSLFHKIAFIFLFSLHLSSSLIFSFFGFFSVFYFFFVSFTLPKLAYLAFHQWIDKSKKAMPKLKEFLLFMFFFPVLFHGPILRRETFKKNGRGNFKRLMIGLTKSTTGWLIVFCFNVSLLNIEAMSSQEVLLAFWLNALAFYFSFAGLMDCVIAVSGYMGFSLPENFPKNPYLQSNISDFWRNWHATLTKWLTDYVYIPLGGKNNPFSPLAVFFLIGLAHMNWQNIQLHALDSIAMLFLFVLIATISLMVSKLIERHLKKSKTTQRKRKILSIFGTIITFNLACLYWILLFNSPGTLKNLGIFFQKVLFLG